MASDQEGSQDCEENGHDCGVCGLGVYVGHSWPNLNRGDFLMDEIGNEHWQRRFSFLKADMHVGKEEHRQCTYKTMETLLTQMIE